MANLLSPGDVRRLSGELGVRPTKKWGQNFVVDAGTVRKIVRIAGVDANDHVLEVGPGLGSLTLALLETGARVTAVEIDPTLAAALPETVAGRTSDGEGVLAVIGADAMAMGPDDVEAATEASTEPPTALVANLPYNVSVPVILHTLAEFPSVRRALVMVQAEVADRLAAPPGSRTYGIPSAKAAWFADVRHAGDVKRNAFFPVPRVDSKLLLLERRDPPPTTAPRALVFDVIDAAFAHRRKALRGSLRDLCGSAEESATVLAVADVDALARGETLDIAAFARIAEAIQTRRASTD